MSNSVSLGPMTVRPPKKQRELLVFIAAFIKEYGYSPSYREIMNGCQYNSVATVALHVGNLIKRGHLRKRDHSARSIEVVSDVYAADGSGNTLEDLAGDSKDPDRQGQVWLLKQTERLLALGEKSLTVTATELDAIQSLFNACRTLKISTTTLDQRFEKLHYKRSRL